MIWLLTAVASGAVAAVGFWRGTAQGVATQTLPALAGVVFGLLMFRATTEAGRSRETLGQLGGWPLRAAGALALTAALAAAIDVGVWLQRKQATFGPAALPLSVLAFVLLMITALRLSLGSTRRRSFMGLALVSAVNAVAAVYLFVSTQLPGLKGD